MVFEEFMMVMLSIIVVYDNMCYVDGLKVVCVDFLFEDFLKKVWQCVVKVIDKLYICNYKDEKCKILYNLIDKVFDGYNIMVVEQIFVWGSRFEWLICVMLWFYQFFYFYRFVKW